MDAGLWQIYLDLQASPYDRDGASYRGAEMLPGGVGQGTLVIGPGGPEEIGVLRPRVPNPVTALTVFPGEVGRIHGVYPDVETLVGDMHDMPFSAGRFETVFSSNVLEHSFAPYVALTECRRVLKSGGQATFVLPSFVGVEGGAGPYHLHCLTREVWCELLRKTGFVVERAPIVRTVWDEITELEAQPHYVQYYCRAVEPPWPHDELLRRVDEYKRARSRG